MAGTLHPTVCRGGRTEATAGGQKREIIRAKSVTHTRQSKGIINGKLVYTLEVLHYDASLQSQTLHKLRHEQFIF